jgi:hypothetical protein
MGTPSKTFRTTVVSVLFRKFSSCFMLFDMSDQHKIPTLSENVKFICTRCEPGQKSSQKEGQTRQTFAFLKFVQINLIFSDNVHILSISKRRISF